MRSTPLFLLAALALAFVYVASAQSNVTEPENTTCGGNCPGGCPSCPCGTTKDVVDPTSYCQKHSDWSQYCCKCIASKESGYNANAANYNTGGTYDVGMWQINQQNWDSCSGGKAPCSINTNEDCAHKVWGWGGNTWRLWSTCGLCGDCCNSA
mmetsp:Transcript_10208/g.15382  ORF Transcript_10208/g.15382 Transcript_10208/m.15382 type:complete len:153 (-) Transcript_10208:48-506(-)|eukprot:CAMPEP_0201509076 /NCGR_PEP_ID=MMETSP0161_2-20130828/2234_1 /ASSEMBLY_ACC=CAM_ASM_000251 /TAXON_ID=180227 /ORGANISM="Neoparamoeba aestuarina, Strain SoJaBio B1-5/56/2" /LENGTH=152 /DNA_ID=CAMNT_0047903923 /DNA_START=30 /DNA_END=488 /DNA_ORIENTATION=-